MFKEDKYYILFSWVWLLFGAEGGLLLFCWIGREVGGMLRIKGLVKGGYIIGVVYTWLIWRGLNG